MLLSSSFGAESLHVEDTLIYGLGSSRSCALEERAREVQRDRLWMV